MTRIVFAAALALAATLPIVSAQAQAPRTFVSAAGTDNPTCSFAAPCRHFQNAVNVTSAGGEVDALDPAGYGPITISQAITIEGQGWSYIAPPAFGNGIAINAMSGKVTIRGVSLNGVGITGTTTGIRFTSGASLNVQNCVIANFSGTGILFVPNTSSKISLSNTHVSDSYDRISIDPTGTGTTGALLDHVHVENSVHDGITVSSSSQMLSVIVNESISANNGGTGVATTSNPGATANVYVRNSTIYNNDTALSATGNGNTAQIVVTRSMIADNGVDITGSGYTYTDNNFLANNQGSGSLNPIPYQ